MCKNNFSELKIISGGQTGVDRGALDAALENGFSCGGWCPEGRKAEDGIITDKYPLVELPGGNYRQRTLSNVLAGDGTMIIYFAYPEGGTEEALRFCLEWKKPYLLIDAAELSVAQAKQRIEKFLVDFDIVTLNVAGPRASIAEQAYTYSYRCLFSLLNEKVSY